MRKLPIIAALLAFGTIFAFQNCSSSSPPSANDSSVATASYPSLGLFVPNPNMITNESQTVLGMGGKPPLTYSVTGGCVITPAGVLTAASNDGAICIITVSDQQGLQATGQVQVKAPVATPTPEPTPTPVVCSDITYNDPQGMRAYPGQNGTVTMTSDFSSVLAQIPSGCRIASIAVNFRRAGNAGFGCAQAGYYPPTSPGGSASTGFINGGGSGNKTQFGQARFTASAVNLTETSAGWGDAGGSSTSACISNVSLLLHVVAN